MLNEILGMGVLNFLEFCSSVSVFSVQIFPYLVFKCAEIRNSGELILNRAQQDSLAPQITNQDNDRPIYITTVIELDGTVIAKKVFEAGSRGNCFIRSRGVVR